MVSKLILGKYTDSYIHFKRPLPKNFPNRKYSISMQWLSHNEKGKNMKDDCISWYPLMDQ